MRINDTGNCYGILKIYKYNINLHTHNINQGLHAHTTFTRGYMRTQLSPGVTCAQNINQGLHAYTLTRGYMRTQHSPGVTCAHNINQGLHAHTTLTRVYMRTQY